MDKREGFYCSAASYNINCVGCITDGDSDAAYAYDAERRERRRYMVGTTTKKKKTLKTTKENTTTLGTGRVAPLHGVRAGVSFHFTLHQHIC